MLSKSRGTARNGNKFVILQMEQIRYRHGEYGGNFSPLFGNKYLNLPSYLSQNEMGTLMRNNGILYNSNSSRKYVLTLDNRMIG